jgi:hypothetical protein
MHVCLFLSLLTSGVGLCGVRLVRLRRDSLQQVFFPQGPHFRKETLALAKDCPHVRIS